MIGKQGFSLLPFLGTFPIFANNNYTLTNSYANSLKIIHTEGFPLIVDILFNFKIFTNMRQKHLLFQIIFTLL